MNASDMIEYLAYRVGDPGFDFLKRPYILKEINGAMRIVCTSLNNNYLTELEVMEEVTSHIAVDGNDMNIDISEFNYSLLPGKENVLGVMLEISGSKYYSRSMTYDEIRKAEKNDFYKNSGSNPDNLMHYVDHNKIIIKNYTSETTGGYKYYVFYVREPAELEDTTTSSPEVGESLQPIILRKAEAGLYMSPIRDANMAKLLNNDVMGQINMLNGTIKPTDNIGYRAVKH